MKSDAQFSKCRKYRYALWRIWDESKPLCMFIGLNPSIAHESEDDPTIRRCVDFAKSWGYGGLCMTNLFALVDPDPAKLKIEQDPIGFENDNWLRDLSKSAGVVVAAWGNRGAYLGRSKEVTSMIKNLKCIKINKTGEPVHPLYQPRTSNLKQLVE